MFDISEILNFMFDISEILNFMFDISEILKFCHILFMEGSARYKSC